MSMCSEHISLILEELFKPAKKILQKEIDNLTLSNTDKTKYKENIQYHMYPAKYGFVCNDKVFISTEGKFLAVNDSVFYATYKWNPLDTALEPRFKEIESLYSLIKKNEEYLPRLFTCMLQGAVDMQDIYNKLPDNIDTLLSEHFTRTKEFKVSENIQPFYFMCKDDIDYLINLRILQ